MGEIAAALVPILVPIVLGLALKRAGFLFDEAWTGLEQLTYFILFPCLLIRTLGVQSVAGVPWSSMLATIAGTLLTAAALLAAWHRLRPSVPGPTFTSIFQGGVRFNSYIALAVAQTFFGAAFLVMPVVILWWTGTI